MDINTTTSNRNLVLPAPDWPRQWALAPGQPGEAWATSMFPSVDPRQGISGLCCGLASERFSLFVADGDINDRESIAKGLPPHAVVCQKEHIRLMDLVWRGDVEFWSWNVPWSRQIDLPDSLLLEPVLGLLLSLLWLRVFWSPLILPVASGAVVNASKLPPSRSARYSSKLISLQQASATGQGSFATPFWIMLGHDITRRSKRKAAYSSRRQRSRDFCATSIIVRARVPGILCRLACHPTPSIAKWSS